MYFKTVCLLFSGDLQSLIQSIMKSRPMREFDLRVTVLTKLGYYRCDRFSVRATGRLLQERELNPRPQAQWYVGLLSQKSKIKKGCRIFSWIITIFNNNQLKHQLFLLFLILKFLFNE